MKAKDLIIKYSGCEQAIKWAGDKTIQEAWRSCERGDWMLWIYNEMYPNNIKELTLAKAHCGNTVRHLVTDERCIMAIDTAFAFANGEATLKQLKLAALNSYAAASKYANATEYAYYAACVAAWAVTADNPDAVAHYTADAAYFSSDNPNLSASAKMKNRLETADICRKYLTIE